MMRIRWYGQSAFALARRRLCLHRPVRLDGRSCGRERLEWNYPPISGQSPDLLLVTHEHGDHNGIEGIDGTPTVLRSTAGRFESPVGEVVGIASEHDDVAGTARGANTIFCFSLGGLRVCHLGDLGQPALRPEQRAAIGDVDVLFLPAGRRADDRRRGRGGARARALAPAS